MHDGAEQLSSCTDAPDGHTAASLGILLELARECNSAGQAPLIDQLTPSLDLQPFPLRPTVKRGGSQKPPRLCCFVFGLDYQISFNPSCMLRLPPLNRREFRNWLPESTFT